MLPAAPKASESTGVSKLSIRRASPEESRRTMSPRLGQVAAHSVPSAANRRFPTRTSLKCWKLSLEGSKISIP